MFPSIIPSFYIQYVVDVPVVIPVKVSTIHAPFWCYTLIYINHLIVNSDNDDHVVPSGQHSHSYIYSYHIAIKHGDL